MSDPQQLASWPPAGPRPWVVGMVHLAALPGTPFGELSLGEVVARAVDDARALADAGADAVLVQNRGDRSFPASVSAPEVVAGTAVATRAVVSALDVPVGVHLLRNDTAGSVAVAHTTGAAFVRAAVLTGRSESAQGPLVGAPDATLRYRHQLGADHVALLADVASMHNLRAEDEVAEAASEAVFFGGAAAVSVAHPDPDTAVRLCRAAAGAGVPVLVAGYATRDNVAKLLAHADGVVVGSAVERGDRQGGVDPALARAFVAACRG